MGEEIKQLKKKILDGILNVKLPVEGAQSLGGVCVCVVRLHLFITLLFLCTSERCLKNISKILTIYCCLKV
jgi:hypothetical protein